MKNKNLNQTDQIMVRGKNLRISKEKATTARKAGKTEKKKERAILRESPISRSQRMVDITEALTEMPDLERIRTRMISR